MLAKKQSEIQMQMIDIQQNLKPNEQFPLLSRDGSVPKIENYNKAVETITERGIKPQTTIAKLLRNSPPLPENICKNEEDLNAKIADL